MLTHIHIRNFIIVKSLSLDFQDGLHVLTGETGAGKSIWIDAIEIGLGGRADANLIYPGEKNADITLCFDLANQPAAKQFLISHDLPSEDECIIRRVIDQNKPSRTTLNGIPIPQQLVRQFSEIILCIHGQHQHQRLLKSDEQRDLLDHYAENASLLLDIQTHYAEWKARDRDIQTLKNNLQNKSSDLTLWQYQHDELQTLQLQENEYEQLFSQYQQLHHGKQFAVTLNEALSLIDHDENPSANALAQNALQHLNAIGLDDPKLENIRSLLQTAAIHLEEASDALQQYCYDLDFGGDRLLEIEQRLATLQDAARKHHVDPSELHTIANSLQQKIEQLEQADQTISQLETAQNKTAAQYQVIAKTLSSRRVKAAKKLSAEITAQMQTLGMQGGFFDIQLPKKAIEVDMNGNENVHFVIATNPGQSPHNLSDIVSGGELSRLSLIIQMLTAEKKNTPTLIFDEVDVGIGGKTAEWVGKLLRELSKKAQVLCVTHLPQVAANGHHHFKAEKVSEGSHTTTRISLLSKAAQTNELARMLSGATITEKSISHAKELLTLLQ
ncbi:MAG: DNA repair protein RecN [Gammaproteobacteria bacterium CG_4_10_14_0_8_um_filter_38_16]|nr:MAG: DNA repair protein RecN [Gammaproteobacteria bacterium CG_4_10_14_0_8_um_filter_38_16]PJA02644.1 MAG: DNA repair protein RecN [Gammaproteobacteria bacterium CG_4_10_14_0_2_um_filter_38_22]PJB11100.1 MAG: DNA repair protein RecN [Gammaproteobacteria bacterium CG_4_9_14_3_um_filter_38_9]